MGTRKNRTNPPASDLSGKPPDGPEKDTPRGCRRGACQKSKVRILSTEVYIWKPKASIVLTNDEERALRWFYRIRGIPTDQYVRRPREWRDFTRAWNLATGRTDSPQEILFYMVRCRKQGNWVRLGTRYKPLADLDLALTNEQWEAMGQIYQQINVGSDNYMYDAALVKEFRRRFYAIADIDIGELELIAGLIARRKRGLLPTLHRPQGRKRPRPFGDIDAISM